MKYQYYLRGARKLVSQAYNEERRQYTTEAIEEYQKDLSQANFPALIVKLQVSNSDNPTNENSHRVKH